MVDRFDDAPYPRLYDVSWIGGDEVESIIGPVPLIKRMDILDVTEGMIVHQINPVVMGAGLALLIRRRYPQVQDDFLEAKIRGKLNLGHVVTTKVTPKLWVASYVGQLTFGRGGRHTSLSAIDDALLHIEKFTYIYDIKPVYLPWKMGCGLAGGDWDEVAPLIGNRLPNCIICKL